MNGAACLAPDDCWFGGGRLSGSVNKGAFHLHWDGTALTPWPSLTVRDPSVSDPDRSVTDIVAHQGALYESVSVDGNVVDSEPDDQPFLLHEIQTGSPPTFRPCSRASRSTTRRHAGGDQDGDRRATALERWQRNVADREQQGRGRPADPAP